MCGTTQTPEVWRGIAPRSLISRLTLRFSISLALLHLFTCTFRVQHNGAYSHSITQTSLQGLCSFSTTSELSSHFATSVGPSTTVSQTGAVLQTLILKIGQYYPRESITALYTCCANTCHRYTRHEELFAIHTITRARVTGKGQELGC